jgi:hypothetical protein
MKCRNNKQNTVIYILLFLITIGVSQDYVAPDSINSNIKIYLDCDDCDFSFFRRNLEYIDFVRDNKNAEAHILVTKQRTAVGGVEYGINFIGIDKYADMHYKLKTISPQFESNIMRWERLLKIIELGLLPYLSNSNSIENINIQYNNNNEVDKLYNYHDPWNYWVFHIGLSSYFEAEETQRKYSLKTLFSADQITKSYKLKSRLSYGFNKESYDDNDDKIDIIKEEAEFDLDFAYSLNSRWSLGLFCNISRSSYLNQLIAQKAGPAIEYNIFPWDQSDRKVFTISYRINANYFKYDELTIFNKMAEKRISQALHLSIILRQPWGSIESKLKGSNYFFDFSKNRLILRTNISVNIAKGFSIFSNINAELIHDQLYLPSSEATLEELLLQQRQLGTAFDISGNIGIRFTFGSIYNNIVNPRFH